MGKETRLLANADVLTRAPCVVATNAGELPTIHLMNSSIRSPLYRALLGAIGGVVATGPMTVAMVLLHRQLPRRERYPLPPREITMKLARATGVEPAMTPEAKSAATVLSHFGYGAVAGALYSSVAEKVPAAGAARGTLFGLLLWSASYLGWLPATGILSPATEHPGRRNALMIAVHVVWGVTLGVFFEVMQREALGDAALSAPGRSHRDVE